MGKGLSVCHGWGGKSSLGRLVVPGLVMTAYIYFYTDSFFDVVNKNVDTQ